MRVAVTQHAYSMTHVSFLIYTSTGMLSEFYNALSLFCKASLCRWGLYLHAISRICIQELCVFLFVCPELSWQGQMAFLLHYHALYKVLPCLHGILNVTQTLETQQSWGIAAGRWMTLFSLKIWDSSLCICVRVCVWERNNTGTSPLSEINVRAR